MLGDVCTFENGDRGSNYPSRSAQTRRGIPFINAGHLTDDGIDIQNLNFIPRERFDLLRNGKIRAGDILFCLRGSLGKFASVGSLSEGAIASSLVIVRPGELVLREYILAYFRSDLCSDMISQFKNGAAQPNLGAQSVKKFVIPIPPISEQRRIVGILDEAFKGIAVAKANAEKNVRHARALFENYREAVFTQHAPNWALKQLADFATTQYGLSQPMNELGKGFKIFRMGEVQDGRLVDTGRMKFADITEEEFQKYRLQSGDVLFNRTNSFELVGKTGIFELEGDYCFASYLIRVLPDPHVMLPAFLNYFMNSKRFQKSVKQKASRSINQANINATILSQESIPFPESLKEQRLIVAKLDSLRAEGSRLESLYQHKIAALEALKKSLLYQAFTGNL